MKNPRQTQYIKNPIYQNPNITKQQQILHNSNMSKTKQQQQTQDNRTPNITKQDIGFLMY